MSVSKTKEPSDSERTVNSLLRSMSADGPRPSAKQATLAALGLGAAATTAAGTAGAVLGVAGVAKLLALGALAGAVVTGVTVEAQHVISPAVTERAPSMILSSSSPEAIGSKTAARSAEVPPVSFDGGTNADGPASVPAQPTSDRAGSPATTDASRVRTDAPSSPAALPPVAGFAGEATASSLRDETSELDRARAALAAGNARATLAQLDRYDAAFPGGALAPEAALLRVRAVLAIGDRTAARKLAISYAAAHPGSPHLAQLRTLLEP